MSEVEAHLGGYVAGGDPDTTYPALWRHLIDNEGVRSVLDVGAGDGRGAVDWFNQNGARAVGIDGVDTGHPEIILHDFSTGVVKGFDGIVHPNPEYDLVWSAEFVEHVEEKHVPNFLREFSRAPLVLMTHAVPGQGGHHHVNCQPGDYWIGAMAAIGYHVDWPRTTVARALAQVDFRGNYSYFAATGLAFRRYP